MGIEDSQSDSKMNRVLSIRRWISILQLIAKCGWRLYGLLAPRAYSVIMFAALFCTLAVKFFYSLRTGLVNEYFSWVLADISTLLGIEAVLALLCFGWPRKLVIRGSTLFAAIVCTWSVMNAGLIIRKGMQILPTSILPLCRNPLNAFPIIGHNLLKMPVAAVILLGPSAIALTFFFFVMAKPSRPHYNRKRFVYRIAISVFFVFAAVLFRVPVTRRSSEQVTFVMLRYNCQIRAVTCLFSSAYEHIVQARSNGEKRKIPAFDELQIEMLKGQNQVNHNIVIVVLEGVQYRYTSLADERRSGRIIPDCGIVPPNNLTPYMLSLANEGVEFVSNRSSLTHTTKTLFSLLTGRYPSVDQDLAETVPLVKPYASLATILKEKLNFRTAFFQSAKGNFESRPSLVHNLGFDKFWARDDLGDPNAFIGYLGCDEFAMLEPIAEWVKNDERPFLLTIMCSVTHDPYDIPEWFEAKIPDRLASLTNKPVERYWRTIYYTDRFLAALGAELAKLNLIDKTIFCVVGDHGEAFGEHSLHGHERIAFDDTLRVPFIMRAPSLIERARKVVEPVGSVDLTPTLLALLGFDTNSADFEGINALADIPDDRKVYFAGWLWQSSVGFVKGNHKFIYNPANKRVVAYDLSVDWDELVRIELPEEQERQLMDGVIAWRRYSIFQLDQERAGEKVVFGRWLCNWRNRISGAKYRR
jgi:hypothetical protein